MEDESSNDVIAMEYEEPQASSLPVNVENNVMAGRPLMQFFKRLIFNKHSQNTMLTNAQLEDILRKEFNFDLVTLHALELDIYVTILKKYLKEWPQWDEFETTTKQLPEHYEPNTFVTVLEKRYKSLKSYLKANLEMAKELSADIVAKTKKGERNRIKALSNEAKSSEPSSVVLEVKSTRDQLNRLIYRQPRSEFNYTIFKVDDKSAPSQITVNRISLGAILNWWSIKITISLQMNTMFITRRTAHELEHLLVNRQGEHKTTGPSNPVVLNQEIQIQDTKKVSPISNKQILTCLNFLSSNHDAQMEGMETIIQFVKKDLEDMHVIVAPASYKRYLSKYPYVRYLYSEADSTNKNDKTNYDIQLKETISPMHQFSVGRLDIPLEKSLPPQWLKVECITCHLSFSGEYLATELKQHFDEYHHAEPDWQCTNCQVILPMATLAENWWSHKCID